MRDNGFTHLTGALETGAMWVGAEEQRYGDGW